MHGFIVAPRHRLETSVDRRSRRKGVREFVVVDHPVAVPIASTNEVVQRDGIDVDSVSTAHRRQFVASDFARQIRVDVQKRGRHFDLGWISRIHVPGKKSIISYLLHTKGGLLSIALLFQLVTETTSFPRRFAKEIPLNSAAKKFS